MGEKGCDKMCTENSCVKTINIDHEIIYGSYDSGVFVISPRDFCYMKARHKLTNYKGPDGKEYDISCTLCYSVDKSYPYFRDSKKKHVRAILKYSGYVFIEDKSVKNPTNECRACYIVYLDPAGWIPTWVVNLVAPDQGMVIKEMVANWPKVDGILEKRKENGYKRDREFMFDEPQRIELNQEEEKGNDDETDDKIVGGWKKGESEELFEVANAIKMNVEEQAKKDEKEAFKIFEVIEGTKQVVAGTNFKIKVRVADDTFIQVLVFRSLPPISHEL